MFDALSPLEELIFFFTFALLPFVWASLLAVIGNQVADRISTIVFSIFTNPTQKDAKSLVSHMNASQRHVQIRTD